MSRLQASRLFWGEGSLFPAPFPHPLLITFYTFYLFHLLTYLKLSS